MTRHAGPSRVGTINISYTTKQRTGSVASSVGCRFDTGVPERFLRFSAKGRVGGNLGPKGEYGYHEGHVKRTRPYNGGSNNLKRWLVKDENVEINN